MNLSALIGGKFIFSKKSFTRFALQSECCNFNQWEHSNYNKTCDLWPGLYLQIPTENHPYPINDDPKGEKAEQKGGEGCQTPCKSQTNVLNCNVIEHLFIL